MIVLFLTCSVSAHPVMHHNTATDLIQMPALFLGDIINCMPIYEY